MQTFLLSLLDNLEMPYGRPSAKAYITPPDPRVQAKIPAIYIWPSDGDENRSPDLGGTVPRNTGPNTASGTKGIHHRFDIYLTWFSAESGRPQDPVFPGMVDAVMMALRYSQPNPAYLTDPNTNITSTVYNIGEEQTYRTGVESTADERQKRYDCLINLPVWELITALSSWLFAVRILLVYADVGMYNNPGCRLGNSTCFPRCTRDLSCNESC